MDKIVTHCCISLDGLIDSAGQWQLLDFNNQMAVVQPTPTTISLV